MRKISCVKVSSDLTVYLCVCVCEPHVYDQPLVLPPSLIDNLLDFGVCSATHTSSIIFVVVNSNPIEVRGRNTTSCVCGCRSHKISSCLCDSSEFLKCDLRNTTVTVHCVTPCKLFCGSSSCTQITTDAFMQVLCSLI